MKYSAVGSSRSLVIYAIAMCGAYVLTAFYPDLPFLAFATQITVGFIAYWTKRLIQKREGFNGKDT